MSLNDYDLTLFDTSKFFIRDRDFIYTTLGSCLFPHTPAGTFSLSSLTPVSYEEAYGIPTHTASGEPVFYFPRTRELKIKGASVTVPEEFMDYIRLRDFLGFSTDETECDDVDPIDLSEFLT